MIYEMRVYPCLPGRAAGAVENVSRDDAEAVGEARHPAKRFFTTLVAIQSGTDYFLAGISLAEREKKWNAFATDRMGSRLAPDRGNGQTRRQHRPIKFWYRTAFLDGEVDGHLLGSPDARAYGTPDIRDIKTGLISPPLPGMVAPLNRTGS